MVAEVSMVSIKVSMVAEVHIWQSSLPAAGGASTNCLPHHRLPAKRVKIWLFLHHLLPFGRKHYNILSRAFLVEIN